MKNRKRRQIAGDIISYIILIIASFAVILPFGWIISTSLKKPNEVFANPPRWIPNNPTIQNYTEVLHNNNLPKAFLNSLIIGAITAVTVLVIGGLSGYAFSRYKFRGNKQLSVFMLISQLLPVTILMIPFYFMLNDTGLIDNKLGVAFAHMAVTLPMVMWMTKGYFEGIPKELEEAAMLDGCSTFQLFRLIIIPMLRPSLAATGIYAFISSWNDFVLSSILTRSMDSRTLPLTLSEFSTYARVDWGDTMAAATIIAIPVIFAFMLVQKQFVEGMASGAVKG
jgi:ABC-type glycerol-3-phosphate transport system permease component